MRIRQKEGGILFYLLQSPGPSGTGERNSGGFKTKDKSSSTRPNLKEGENED